MAFTEGEWQNWFCSFLGVPLPSMLALIANNRKCPCGRPYDAHAHHVNTCIHCNKTRAHNKAFRANMVTGVDVLELTSEDSREELGISTLAVRKALIQAIRATHLGR